MRMDNVRVQEHKSQPVIIAGMHRSGTSLTASILQAVGVNIGHNLLGASEGNIKGHFEDLDFYSLHQRILISQGFSSEGWIGMSKVDVPQQFIAEAKNLCEQRMMESGLWGWKDPRTTLFLDFWEHLVPASKYVFVYRSPWEVIDSLFTRGDIAFINNPSLAIRVWNAYNTAILNFYNSHPERSVLIHVSQLRGKAAEFINLLNNKLKLDIPPLKEEIFDGDLMHRSRSDSHRLALLDHFYPEAINILKALDSVADLPDKANDAEMEGPAPSFKEWVFQDWLDIQMMLKSKARLQKLEFELEQVRGELEQARTEVAHLDLVVQHMENSTFWKVQKFYNRMRLLLGLKE
jgi:O-antigen biosynthesis protein